MLLSTRTAASLLAAGLTRLTDSSFAPLKHQVHPSFAHRLSPSWSEATHKLSGSAETILVTLYNRTNITIFTTTTVSPASASFEFHQISLPLNRVTTTTRPSTVIYTTTIISSLSPSSDSNAIWKIEGPVTPSDKLYADEDGQPAPALHTSATTAVAMSDMAPSGCQQIVISVIVYLTPPSSPFTAYPKEILSRGSSARPLYPRSGLQTQPSQKFADGRTSFETAVGGSDQFAAKLWSSSSTSAIISLSDSIPVPPYPFNTSTAFPAGRSDLTRDLRPASASAFATSVRPSSFSQPFYTLRIPSTRDLKSTLSHVSSSTPTMVSLLFTDSSVKTILEVISLLY